MIVSLRNNVKILRIYLNPEECFPAPHAEDFVVSPECSVILTDGKQKIKAFLKTQFYFCRLVISN